MIETHVLRNGDLLKVGRCIFKFISGLEAAYHEAVHDELQARLVELDRINAELRRQVAERSRELADALARLAQGPRAIDAHRIIDGRYRVIRQLGAGGMGTVYEVERAADSRRLALKTLRGVGSPEVMARFAREAQIAASIEHPNLVSVLDVGIDGGLFLVMPLVAGGSLEHARKQFGDPAWARPFLTQIASGLVALHERGIIHRDLKPGNVLLAGDVAMISDFGLSSLADAPQVATIQSTSMAHGALADTAAPNAPLTRLGDVFGTPMYMAPELSRGTKEATSAIDVFAFGVMACEMMSGRPPYLEPPIVAHSFGREATLQSISGIDDPYRSMIERCLAVDPAQRPTAGAIVALFDR
jgi:serine/threonine-protein kinase